MRERARERERMSVIKKEENDCSKRKKKEIL